MAVETTEASLLPYGLAVACRVDGGNSWGAEFEENIGGKWKRPEFSAIEDREPILGCCHILLSRLRIVLALPLQGLPRVERRPTGQKFAEMASVVSSRALEFAQRSEM